jgi:sphinganine C4-monooxygenase
MAFTVSDEVLGSVIPVVVYWVYSGIFVILGDKLDKYRLHSKAEEDAKNIVSKWTVIKGVLLQQAIQIVVSVLLLDVTIDTHFFFIHKLLHIFFKFYYFNIYLMSYSTNFYVYREHLFHENFRDMEQK